MKNISILGCGWLGKALGLALHQHGFEVAGSTTQESKVHELRFLGIKPYVLQLTPAVQGENANEFFKTDCLIISIPPKLRSGSSEIYVAQLEEVASIIRSEKIEHVIFISSTAVYADRNRVVTEEDADANSPLLLAEDIIREACSNTTVIRFAGLVGPGRHPGKFLAGKKDVAGGSNPVNIIHQSDCVAIIIKIIQQHCWGEVFNATADMHPTKNDFYTHAARQLKLEPPQFSTEAAGFKIISTEKVKHVLAYEFQYPDPMEMQYD